MAEKIRKPSVITASSQWLTSARIAWILCALCVVGAVTQLIIWTVQLTGRPSLFDLVEALGWGLAMPLVFSVLAVLIIARQPGNRVGWLMMIAALATINPIPSLHAQIAVPPTNLTPGSWLLLWLDGWSWIPVIFPIFLIPLHFPTGRPPSPRWNWVNRLAIGMWLFFMLLVSFGDKIGPINADWKLPNPIGFIPSDLIDGPVLIIWGIGLLTIVSASVVSLIVRYRRAQQSERQQIKWLLYAGALFIVVYTLIYFLSKSDAFAGSGWSNLFLVFSILAIPLAIAIAILRYRLYDIDIIIRKTLVYAVVTAALALVYFGSVVFLQNLVENLTGQDSPIVIVISTLAIAALFNPLRLRVQNFIDRRFFRQRYNAEQSLANFSTIVRNAVDVDKLTVVLLGVVETTIQPERVSIWLSSGRQNQDKSVGKNGL